MRSELYATMARRPIAWLAVAAAIGGAAALFTGFRGRLEMRAFAGSCTVILVLLGGAAAAMFPVMLYSSLAPEHSMTAYNGSSGERSLRVALYWWPVALVFSFAYFAFVIRYYRGKVNPAEDTPSYS